MSQRPKITAENHQKVYNYYLESRNKPHFRHIVHQICDNLYNPDVTFMGEQTREHITAQLALGKGALIAMNHPSYHDPFVGAAAFQSMDIPEFVNCTSFGKDALFRGPQRLLFENVGSVPVFRKKSYPDADGRTLIDAGNNLIKLGIDRLQDGTSVWLFPEGTTSRPKALEQLELRDVASGIARMALGASDESSFILPIALGYRTNERTDKRRARHAVVAVGEPITEYGDNQILVRKQVLGGMQTQLERANGIANSR